VLASLAAASMYGGYLYRTSGTLQRLLPPLLQRQSVADVFPSQTALNLMIIGRDRDYDDRTDQVLKSRARSDMLMVAHLDFAKNTISLLSIPRDTRAFVPGRGTTKINAAHQVGGPALSEKVVQNTFGIPSGKYLALDFEGFEQAIDTLGGVDLVVDKKMDYDDNWGHLHIHLKPGFQHLNGQQAMGFVRFRHSDSDLVRTRRQQALIAALKTKLRSPEALAQIGPMLEAIDRHVDSDLTPAQEVALARFAHDTPHQSVHMDTLPSRPVGNDVATNWPEARPMIQSIFGVTPPETALAADDAEGHHRHRRRRHPVRVASLP
jgi:LCP family protein required for cell wall assembly